MAERLAAKETEAAYLRFPAGLKDRLKRAAQASNRTLNAEIVRRLEKSLEEAK